MHKNIESLRGSYMNNIDKMIAELKNLDLKNMYDNDFFLTWEKTGDEIAGVFQVADILRGLREKNISSRIFR